MTIFMHKRSVGYEEVEEIICARNNSLLREYKSGPGIFKLAEGPFTSYQRTVDVDMKTSHCEVTETFSYKIAAPFWHYLLHFPIKRVLKNSNFSKNFNIWWAPPNRFDALTSQTISLLCVAAIVTGFLGALIGQTATFAAEEFGAGDRAQGILLATVRIGVLLTVFITALADNRGRKKLLEFSLYGGCLLAVLSAVAPNLWALGITQSFARGFATSISILIGIMAAEAAPKGSRAYIAGLLTLSAGLGAGIPVWILFLADLHLRGWRLLFATALIFFPVIRWIHLHLEESKRFIDHIEKHRFNNGRKQKVIVKRVLFLASVAFLLFLFVSPASQFRNEFLRDERGFSAAKISLFLLTAYTPQIIGVAIASKVSDLKGRKPVAMIAVGIGTILTVASYSVAGFGMWLITMSAGIISAGAGPSLGVYSSEMFGTGRRGQVSGFLSLTAVTGSALGLLLCGDLSERLNSFGEAFTLLAIGPLLVVLIVYFFFPESANQELEDLNPDDRP